MAKDHRYGSKAYQSSAAGVFLFEGQALSGVCKALIEGVRGKRDV